VQSQYDKQQQQPVHFQAVACEQPAGADDSPVRQHLLEPFAPACSSLAAPCLPDAAATHRLPKVQAGPAPRETGGVSTVNQQLRAVRRSDLAHCVVSQQNMVTHAGSASAALLAQSRKEEDAAGVTVASAAAAAQATTAAAVSMASAEDGLPHGTCLPCELQSGGLPQHGT
jgi:hypothetical protein